MLRLLLALLILAAAILQSAVLPQITLLQVRPNLVLVLILLWTMIRGPREGALWAVGAGLLLDLLTLTPLGTHALALLAVALVATVARTPRFRLGLLQPMLAALVATLAHDTTLLVAERAFGALVPSLLRLSLLAGLLNLAVTPPLHLLTGWLGDWLAHIEATVGRPTSTVAGRLGRR